MIVAACGLAHPRIADRDAPQSTHTQRNKQTRMSMYEYGGEYEELVYCGVRTERVRVPLPRAGRRV